jgi:LacI family transcriptional regulator
MTKITMKEIAKLANVSQPTVSRVINGNEDVNEAIVKRVKKVIEDVGYIPNKAAQTLKRSQSHLIGVCISQIYNPYFVELIDTLELKMHEMGYSIILHNSRHNPITEWENMQNFMARQVDGIIIVPTGNNNINRISKLRIPTVVITQNSKHFDSVGINYIQAGRIAGQYFINKGNKKFGFIGHFPDEKFSGFESILYENGLQFDSKNYLKIDVTSTNNFLIRQDIEKYFNQIKHPEFTCAITTNDIAAIEFMRAAQERDIKVPDDISLIGFDDTFLSKILGITSIHQPIEKMVETTIEILWDRIEDKISSDLIHLQLEPTLVERKSSMSERK